MFDLVNYFLKKLEFFHHALIVRFISPFYLMSFRGRDSIEYLYGNSNI